MPRFKRRPLAALVLTLLSPSPFVHAQTRAEEALQEVVVNGVAESADSPVRGYNATRSATATKTDTPLGRCLLP
jgi:iron complex outermembrane receptor protein